MIDLTSIDSSYTNLKINEIKRMLKDIKPDIKDLSPLEIVNMSIIIFAYLIEGEFVDEYTDGDLTLSLYDDVMFINVEELTMNLKFKNLLVNQIIKQKHVNELEIGETIKELIGDIYGV